MTLIKNNLFKLFICAAVVFGVLSGLMVARISVSNVYGQTQEDVKQLQQGLQDSSEYGDVRKGTNPLGELVGVGSEALGTQNVIPRDPRSIAFGIVKIFLGLIGVILTLLVLYAGYLWFSAGGSEDQVKKAKDTLRNALIGLLIVSLSYAIVTFFIGAVIDTSSQGRECSQGQAQFDPTCAPNPLGSVTVD